MGRMKAIYTELQELGIDPNVVDLGNLESLPESVRELITSSPHYRSPQANIEYGAWLQIRETLARRLVAEGVLEVYEDVTGFWRGDEFISFYDLIPQ